MFLSLVQTDNSSVTLNIASVEWIREYSGNHSMCTLSCNGKIFNINQPYLDIVGQLKGMTAHG